MDMKVTELTSSKNEFINDVLDGLSKANKTLPCKYFYDETGSNLFEAICEQDEYYITRTELNLLDSIKTELTDLIGPNAVIIEPGAGAGIKIQTLLSALTSPHTYVPIDISADFLVYSAEKISKAFPQVAIRPIQGDFCEPYLWTGDQKSSNRVVFFPGSTIGNFTPTQAKQFLINQHQFMGEQGAMIIGFDLVKPVERLEQAYNDSSGVTAEFNKNLLVRINNELGGDFDLDEFEHKAVFNPHHSRIEMHLESQKPQTVNIDQQRFDFETNERIHTENSYKYSLESFANLAMQADLKVKRSWLDEDELICLLYLVPV